MEADFGDLRIVEVDQTAITPKPEKDRVVIRITTHEQAVEAVATTEVESRKSQSNLDAEATAPVDPSLVGEASHPVVNAQPTYDVRTSKAAPRGSRVSLRSARAKTPPPQMATCQATEQEDYLDAVFGLDDDIRQLRAALAQKLETQNGHLRVMLSRFEDS